MTEYHGRLSSYGSLPHHDPLAMQQPQIITNHYRTMNSGMNNASVKYNNFDYEGHHRHIPQSPPLDLSGESCMVDPEWQFPPQHTMYRQHIMAAAEVGSNVPKHGRMVCNSSQANCNASMVVDNGPFVGQNHVKQGIYVDHVIQQQQYRDSADHDRQLNNMTINQNQIHSDSGGNEQHAVVRQLQEKFIPCSNHDNSVHMDGSCPPHSNNMNSNQGPHHNGNNHLGTGILPNENTNGLITPDPFSCCCCPRQMYTVGSQNQVDDGGGGPPPQSTSVSFVSAFCENFRLPFLFSLIVILCFLLVLFLAALVYFKYYPYQLGSFSHYGGDEPCKKVNCAFGASCYVEGGTGVCRCPVSCSESYEPVCGNDDLTYSNECLFRKLSCEQQRTIQIKHNGECNQPNPCADKACLYGSRCVPSSDGLYATCECPLTCPNYGDSDDSVPVCGSDGKYYPNRCELDRYACQVGRNLTVKFFGKCDPCEDILCTPPQVCHLDESRRPVCRCSEMCSMDFSPVCASDGKTYSNECVMRQEACRSRNDLSIIYRGVCSSGVNPCESRTCQGYETCAINKFGIAQCTCPMVCDKIIQPVCGSDGRTYDNHCELVLSACREAKNITMLYKGTCGEESLCSRHHCQVGATCSEKDGKAVCECPTCPADYNPVCGSDGVSYQNECRLRLESCISNKTIRSMYSGLCNGCEEMQCDFYGICEENDGAGGKCVCPKNCSLELTMTAMVCGTDGVTYENECELQRNACQKQTFIMVASKGHCELCSNVQCKFGARCENGVCVCPTQCPVDKDLICGSNLKTYMNECELEKAACVLNRNLSVQFYGDCSQGFSRVAINEREFATTPTTVGVYPKETTKATGVSSSFNFYHTSSTGKELCDSIRCEYGALCELGQDGFPRCTCQFDCNGTRGSPVCGSDLKLYSNECEMTKEACHRQTELRPRPMELCNAEEYELHVVACHGEEPLKDPKTGLDMECGNGPVRTNCPEGSFCHRSSAFAKCCKKRTKVNNKQYQSTIKDCEKSIFGCCPDGWTTALGPESRGCPSICQCNKLGSITEHCDPDTLQCQCREGVGGDKCNRCLPGYWGLTRSDEHGNRGCKHCHCSKFGSVRDDCEQMMGRCVCKPGVLGHKCNKCPEGEFLGPYGCTTNPINLGRNCDEVVCSFGSACEQDGDRAGCVCNIACADVEEESEEVCASDGYTYDNDCLVKLESCRNQKPIWVLHKGTCSHPIDRSGATESTVLRRWTGLHFTEPGDYGYSDSVKLNSEIWKEQMGNGYSSSMKSTRHLPPQSKQYDNFQRSFYNHRSPTSATVQIRSYLGDSCHSNVDCITLSSVCLNGWCICKEGFYEDPERLKCLEIHSHLNGVLSCDKENLCSSPGTCFDHRNGSYQCVCPLGTARPDDQCSEEQHPFPFFSGQSFITLGKLAGYHKLSIELEITPYIDYAHGTVVFSSQHKNGTGDFLSLSLIDGYVEFRYDLGDGQAILRSSSRLKSGSFHQIVAKRYNRDGLLRVDGEHDIKGTSPGTMKSLNLAHTGYMGLVPLNSSKIWEMVGTSRGFVGCVHKLKIGRRNIQFRQGLDPLIIDMHDVLQCPVGKVQASFIPTAPEDLRTSRGESSDDAGSSDGHSKAKSIINQASNLSLGRTAGHYNNPVLPPGNKSHYTHVMGDGCSKNPCQNYGICWKDWSHMSSYRCVCHPEYTGQNCETKVNTIRETGAMLDFRGFSYLQLPKIEHGARHVDIELWVMIRSSSSLILYNGQEDGKGDFLALLVNNAHLQFLFDLGSGIANLTWPEEIDFNKWHWIVATRDGRQGKLQVDGGVPLTSSSPPSLSELNLELPLYIGGVRDMNMMHKEIGAIEPFDGVLQYVKINEETYYREIESFLRKRIVHKYEGPPCGSSLSDQCNHGGSCFPRLDAFVCLCPHQYTGKTCSKRKKVPGPVRFDGQNYLTFPQKQNKHESFNFSEYDEFYHDNFDSQLDELFEDLSSNFNSSVVTFKDDDDLDDDLYDYGNTFKDLNEESIMYEEDEDFVPIVDEDFEESRIKAKKRNRIEVVFRSNRDSSGIVIWTGANMHLRSKKGYIGLVINDGYPELWVNLGSRKNKSPVVMKSKVKISDGRWHQVLIARRRRLIVLQVDGSKPVRAMTHPGSNILITDGRYWIGGVPPSVLSSDIPPKFHQGFIGCVDMVRIKKRRLPLFKIAYSTGTPFCEDD